MTHNPIICAIDTTDLGKARQLTTQLANEVGAFKLGLEFFTTHGKAGVQMVASETAPVFLDLKFHDIPNTVAGAVRGVAGVDAFMLTVHTQGGYMMMKAAADTANERAASMGKKRPLVIGVTVLTSMDDKDLTDIGVTHSLADQVKKLALLAQQAGLDGVVCSPHEIALLRMECGKDFKLIVPGIRPAGSATDDQKRTMTPHEAIQLGADYLVIGRPITEAADPVQAAKDILKSLR